MSTDALRILVSVILLIPATIVVMALFKRNNRLRMGASIILIIGIMLREFVSDSYISGVIRDVPAEIYVSELYREGGKAILAYLHQTGGYVFVVSIFLIVLSIACQYRNKSAQQSQNGRQ